MGIHDEMQFKVHVVIYVDLLVPVEDLERLGDGGAADDARRGYEPGGWV